MPFLNGEKQRVLRRSADRLALPVAAGQRLYRGGLAAISAAGFVVRGGPGATLRGLGVVATTVDNSSGADGADIVEIERSGGWHFFNLGTDLVTRADIGLPAYMVDDQTVARTSGGATRGIAGTVLDVDGLGVWLTFG